MVIAAGRVELFDPPTLQEEMSTSTRKQIGLALIILSIVISATLHLSGVSLVEVAESQTTGAIDFYVLDLHWSTIALLVIASVGLFYTILSGHR